MTSRKDENTFLNDWSLRLHLVHVYAGCCFALYQRRDPESIGIAVLHFGWAR